MKTEVKVGDFIVTTTPINKYVSTAKLVTAVKGTRIYWTVPANAARALEERHGYSKAASVVAVFPSYDAALAAYDAQLDLVRIRQEAERAAMEVYVAAIKDVITSAGGILAQETFNP